jgi:N-sulfoglucosamine sulfohydrolase
MKQKELLYLLMSPISFSAPLFVHAQISEKPNILMVVADDHGADALGCYGNTVIKTPALDALAKDGIRFTNAYCTAASCSPSRSVILTGIHNHANGMFGLEHDFHHFSSLNNIKSLPVYLSENGYQTTRVGKFHVAPEQVFRFDLVLSPGAANDNNSLGRSSIEMADKCEPVFKERNKPFFLYFAVDDPHRNLPFDSWPEPNSFGNKKGGYPQENIVTYDPKDVIVPYFLPDILQTRQELAQYYQSVSRLDQGVARLISLLKKSGKYDNTLIIYISDNGIAFPGAKTTLYDPGIKLPCIIKLPEQKNKNQVSDAMISWVDLTPTILNYAKISIPGSSFQGRSFKSVLDNPQNSSSKEWNEVYASHSLHEVTMYYPMRMVRDKNFKLIWNIAYGLDYPFAWDLYESATWKGLMEQNDKKLGKKKVENFIHRDEFELYDMVNDPEELVNLSRNPEYVKVLNDMKVKLKDFQTRTKDPWLYKWTYQ